MSNADAAWLHMDQPTNLMVITSALWFDEQVDWDRTRELLRTRLVERFPRFRQRVVEGRRPLSGPHWEGDPHFDLDLHLHRIALPGRGDRAALQALVADLMATPLDPAKPLWHWTLIDGYGEGSAIVARMHHCIADGIALSRVLLSLTDEAPDTEVTADTTPPHRGRVGGLAAPVAGALGGARGAVGAVAHEAVEIARHPSGALGGARGAVGAVAHEAVEIARHPSELIDLASEAREDAEALARMLLAPADEPTPLRGDLGVAQRVAWSEPISLEAVKGMGHATGTTVNDVVLTAVAGALRRYLRSRDGLVDELTAFIPFNLRPLDQPLPARLGNRFGLVFLRLPLGIGSRRKRLTEIHRRMEEIKHSPEGALSYGLLGAIGRAPAQVERLVVEQFTAKATAVMTNVPGPRRAVYFAGRPVRGVLVWAPRSGSVPISVSIFSYVGEITVGLMVDAGLVPDPERIIDAFEREIDALLSLKV